MAELVVPLFRVAHARTGDKGDRANISLIAWDPAFYAPIVDQVTPEVVARRFGHRRPSGVRRYLLPNLAALNFVLDAVLDGGVNEALNLDAHGKTLSYLLLGLDIRVPACLGPKLAGPG